MKYLNCFLSPLIAGMLAVSCASLPKPEFKVGEIMPKPRGRYVESIYSLMFDFEKYVEFQYFDSDDEDLTTWDVRMFLFCEGKSKGPFLTSLVDKHFFDTYSTIYLSDRQNRVISKIIVMKDDTQESLKDYIPECASDIKKSDYL